MVIILRQDFKVRSYYISLILRTVVLPAVSSNVLKYNNIIAFTELDNPYCLSALHVLFHLVKEHNIPIQD
jgi:hypothetical protein